MSSLFIPGNLERYTSFQAHSGGTRQIIMNDQGMFSCGDNTVKLTQRRGLVSWIFRYLYEGQTLMSRPTFTDYTLSLSFTNSSSEIVVSGHDAKLFVLNPFRGTLVRQVICR
jgi:hypothetical protein